MWATDADLPALEGFLGKHALRSMFPLANLRDHGLNGNHPRAPSFWLSRKDGRISGALCVTKEGMLMPQCPDLDWTGARGALWGRDLIGVIGPADQTRDLQRALGLDGVATGLDQDEPQFQISLDDLIVPDGVGDIVPLENADKDDMIRWRRDYDIEALQIAPDEAAANAVREYAHYCATNSHVALMDGDTALCTTGFNAQLPNIVQIGGVYTPPDKRAHGHARRAVALHLQQAKAQGVTRATLFSANENATRAYLAIGFTYIGQWTLCLFDGKHRIND